MRHDWSDAWLQQAAGWKAVKEGISLYARGLVQNACWDNDECRGVIQGSKPRRVRVNRLNARIAETFCSCPENQRSGAMCEHAVAIIVAARQIKVHQPVIQSRTITIAEEPTPALAVRFFPYWKQEWQKGRMSFKVEAASRPVEESDRALFAWLKNHGVTTKPLPWVVSLAGGEAEACFECLIGHDDASANDQTIVFLGALPEIRVKSQRVGDQWRFEHQDEAGQFFGQKNSLWCSINERLFQSNDSLSRDFLVQLFAEKCAVMNDIQLFTNESLRSSLMPIVASDPLNEWQLMSVEPMWEGELEGSLRQLRLRVTKCYQVESQAWSMPLFSEPGYLCRQGDVCYYAQPHDQESIERFLRQQGWLWKPEGNHWVIDQEDAILTFLSEGKDELRDRFRILVESPQWHEVQKRLTIVRPTLQVRDANSRELAVEWEFRSSTGVAFNGDKIRKLLTSGKRLIQTNDGQCLLLPKESWDHFQQTATDMHWQQQKGEFLAQKSHAILIEYLRKYTDETLNVNDFSIQSVVDFPLLHAQFRDYQLQGASWLHERLVSHGFALLADEMGLGKTLQTIAVMTLRACPDRPALVVVPTTLLHNWELEIKRFAPSLQTIVLHGAKRDEAHKSLRASVIVTSYGVLMKDRALFMKREYSLMVLDEASAIRNPDTDVARCCFRIQADAKLALTGTPLENSMQDLWSIFQYLQPGYLGDRQQFRDAYERSGSLDRVALQSLRLRVMPFMLRRTKAEVIKDLPDKVETDEWCDLSPEQLQLYQSVWEQGAETIERMTKANDSAAHMTLLTLLLRLRQICCDAGLFAPELLHEWTLEQRSSKMARLFDLINGTLESGRKMLVFSQFATQLRNIESECRVRNIATLRLDGATRNRQELVNRFQNDPEPSVFLISLKAGGYGLNLTAASTVVHFDPWWNPASEQQASDRAHRIGQTNSVNVYKLLTRGTVEERVKLLQSQKSTMAAQLFAQSGSTGSGSMPSMQELKELLQVRQAD
jgi:hypothetical protein